MLYHIQLMHILESPFENLKDSEFQKPIWLPGVLVRDWICVVPFPPADSRLREVGHSWEWARGSMSELLSLSLTCLPHASASSVSHLCPCPSSGKLFLSTPAKADLSGLGPRAQPSAYFLWAFTGRQKNRVISRLTRGSNYSGSSVDLANAAVV